MQMHGTVVPSAMPGSQVRFCSQVALRTMMSLIAQFPDPATQTVQPAQADPTD